MPSGKVHDAITIGAALAAAPLWWFATPAPQNWTNGAALVGSILFSGLMLSPDLDLHSSVYRRWGPFRFVWWPYQRAVPHRSWLSHSWVAGPVLRIAYFLGVVWLLGWAILWALGKVADFAPAAPERNPVELVGDVWGRYPDLVLTSGAGILIGNALHTGADAVVSLFKGKR